jgi:hypothetical protein
MAQRRMFSKSITNSSQFLMMPDSSQALYFHLGMNADDDGFCEHFSIMRMTNSKPDDLKILHAKGFVRVFNDSVLVILDWKENNYLRADRYTPSKYLSVFKEEMEKILLGIPEVDTGKVRIGKDREDTSDSDESSEHKHPPYSEDEQTQKLAELEEAIPSRRDDIVHTEPLPAPAALKQNDMEHSGGNISKVSKSKKTHHYTEEELELKNYVADMLSTKYYERNGHKALWTDKDGVALHKIVMTGVSKKRFKEMLHVYCKHVNLRDRFYESLDITPSQFQCRFNNLSSEVGGLSDDQIRAATNGTATKDIWDKVHMK